MFSFLVKRDHLPVYYMKSVSLSVFLYQSTDIPRITKRKPSSFTVREGDNFSLSCSAEGFPSPEVTWYKNGQKILRGHSPGNGILVFPDIQFGDRGLYRCEARNFIGFDTASFKIVVEGEWSKIVSPLATYLKYELQV